MEMWKSKRKGIVSLASKRFVRLGKAGAGGLFS